MMKKYEASAKTVEEAIELGLKELGVGISDVEVKVLEEGSKGLFGLFGSRLAKVSLTVKEEEEDLLEDLMGEEEKKPAPRPRGSRRSPGRKRNPGRRSPGPKRKSRRRRPPRRRSRPGPRP